MFADELDSLDRLLNRGELLRHSRIRAYFDCRDRSEPYERIGHTGARSRLEIRVSDAAPREPNTVMMYAIQPPEGSNAKIALPTGPGDFLKWTCQECGRFVFMWADSGAPGSCPCCHGADLTASPWTGRAA